jgi:hypothetical protein
MANVTSLSQTIVKELLGAGAVAASKIAANML